MGYCFDSRGYHTPGTKLTTPVDAFKYCLHWHHEWYEVRICDEDDYCVMNVIDQKLFIPVSNGPDALCRIIDLSILDTREKLLHFIEEQSSGTK